MSASSSPCCMTRSPSGQPTSTTTLPISFVGTFDPVTFISSFANVGQATTQGVEAFAAGIVSPRLRLHADHTYTEARDDTTGLALLRRPRKQGSLSAIWSPIDKMTATTTLLYLSPWVDGDRSTFVRIVQPGYELARVAAEYTLTDNWTLFGRIEKSVQCAMRGSGGLSSSRLRNLWRSSPRCTRIVLGETANPNQNRGGM